jgi:orotate phosphoribosyltransferase
MLKNNLVEVFYTTHAFKWDPDKGFRLASGLTSPYYVDCRSLMAHPGSRRLVANLAYDALRPMNMRGKADRD